MDFYGLHQFYLAV